MPSDGGTLIEGEFKIHPFVKVFMMVWFSFLGVFFVGALASFSRGKIKCKAALFPFFWFRLEWEPSALLWSSSAGGLAEARKQRSLPSCKARLKQITLPNDNIKTKTASIAIDY